MLQGRNPEWVNRVFFAEYSESATWLRDLRPAFGRGHFFFEPELRAAIRGAQESGERVLPGAARVAPAPAEQAPDAAE